MPKTQIEYLEWLVEHLERWLPPGADSASAVLPYRDDLEALSVLDLEPAREVLEACYAPPGVGGRPRQDPVSMLRSVLLMLRVKETSVNRWVDRLDREPILSLLSGFSPERRPGVGTFYDFFDRIENGAHEKECEHYQRPSTRRKGSRGRFRRNLKKEKEQAKRARKEQEGPSSERPTVRAVRQALGARAEPAPQDMLGRVERVLLRCGLKAVAEAGLVPDLDRLTVSGDGSALETGASGRGKRLCTCPRHEKCECDRSYSDPNARWGWDSYRERFYFGYRLHALVIRVDDVEVPLHIQLDGANTADVLLGVSSLARLERQLRELDLGAKIEHAVFDAGYDADAFHRFIGELGAKPVIPLNPRNKTPVDPNGIPRDEQGRPLCPGGAPMRLHGFNGRNQKTVYNCPAKRPGRDKGHQVFRICMDRCPNKALCEPDTKMGPLVHLALEDSPRLNPAIPRDGVRYRELYSQRTCTERHFSNVHGKGLADRPYRRQHIFYVMTLLHALDRYVPLWTRALGDKTCPKTVSGALDWLRDLAEAKRAQNREEAAVA